MSLPGGALKTRAGSAGIDEVKVRTPLTCETRTASVRQCCWPRSGPRHLVNIGEAVA